MKVSLTFCISSNEVLKLLTEMGAAESNFTLKEKNAQNLANALL